MFTVKVKDRQDLVRETHSSGILNVDAQGLHKYKEEREFKMRLQKTTCDIDRLKNDIVEMKVMMRQLIISQSS